MITGTTSNSRLNELKKYEITNIFSQQYYDNGSLSNDGVDFLNSTSGISVTYYIGGIKYIDNVSAQTTTFYYTPEIEFNDNFYYKNLNLENVIGNPKINDDVFIDRQELSVFDLNYKLEFIRNLTDLNTYAGGKFFNIVNNI